MPMMPPSLSGQPPMGSSPVSTPVGSPGQAAGAMTKLREALNIMNSVISELPMGSEIHSKVMKVVESMNKVLPPGGGAPGVQQTALRDLHQNAAKNAMLQQVMASMGGGAGGAAPQGAGLAQAMAGPR